MRVRYYSSFERTLRRLPALDRQKVRAAIDDLLGYMSDRTAVPPKGIGLKKLHKAVWEIRVGLQIRAIFFLESDLMSFVMVGNHDDVKRFLRNPQ